MKRAVDFIIIISLILLSIILSGIRMANAQSSETLKLEKAVEIKEFKNLYKSGDYYFGGQPTYEMVKWLKSEGVQVVINLRTKDEVKKVEQMAFNEENLLNDFDMKYISIPVSYPDSYNPKTLRQFTEALNENQGKVFIHCTSGGRVRAFFMAYLIQDKGYTINEAMDFCEQINYISTLENLLGKEIEMYFVE